MTDWLLGIIALGVIFLGIQATALLRSIYALRLMLARVVQIMDVMPYGSYLSDIRSALWDAAQVKAKKDGKSD